MNIFKRFKDKISKSLIMIKDYGFFKAVSRGINARLWPSIVIGFVNKMHLDFHKLTDETLQKYSFNLPCRSLSLEEINSKMHFFNDDRLADFKKRIVLHGGKVFCLLNSEESEILGFVIWTDYNYYDENVGLTISLSPGSVYVTEIEINDIYRGKRYGNYLLGQLLFWLKTHGYSSIVSYIAWDNVPSMSLIKRFGGFVERKYFELHIKTHCLIPLKRSKIGS